MQPRHVLAGRVRRDKLRLDLVERHRRGVDDARARRAMGEQFLRHDRAGIETDRAARDEVAPAHRDQIGCARPGADEMYGHGASPLAASAQVAARDHDAGAEQPRVRAGSGESGCLGDRRHAGQRGDTLRMRQRAPACRFELTLRHQHEREAEFSRGCFDAALAALHHRGCDDAKCVRRISCARKRRGYGGLDVGRRRALSASDAGDDHGFTQIHCVTGIAGRQPVLPPTGSARDTAMRISSPPSAGLTSKQHRLGFERHRVGDKPSARAERGDSRVEHPRIARAAADKYGVGRRRA